MPSALIGYTGFVGSNLLGQTHFDDLYNSKNIADIRGRKYDLVVCAAPRADKWWANQNHQADFDNIQSLLASLSSIRAARFILISTIDVYGIPINVDEDSPAGGAGISPYGSNRHWLEVNICDKFPHAQIIRLPGLFGPGLKKNLIYDLIHFDYAKIPYANGTFQFFNICDLWGILEAWDKPLLNLVTEPVSVLQVVACTKWPHPIEFLYKSNNPTPNYNVYSKYVKRTGYWSTAAAILEDIRAFISNETCSL